MPVSYLLLIKNKKILLMRRCNTEYLNGYYGVPAGHFNGNETVRAAMVREAKEETGIVLKEKYLNIVHIINRKGPGGIENERIDFFIVPKRWEGEPKIMEPHKCDDMKWFPLNKLPKKVAFEVAQAIINYRKKIFYSEYGW